MDWIDVGVEFARIDGINDTRFEMRPRIEINEIETGNSVMPAQEEEQILRYCRVAKEFIKVDCDEFTKSLYSPKLGGTLLISLVDGDEVHA